MRVLVASLGFSYHHVMAAANRPGKMALATVNPENERTKNAIAEIQRYAAVASAVVEVKTLDPEDFWRCVGDALDLFAGKHHYYLEAEESEPSASAYTQPPCSPWRTSAPT